jgi:uncharacterized membrane protein
MNLKPYCYVMMLIRAAFQMNQSLSNHRHRKHTLLEIEEYKFATILNHGGLIFLKIPAYATMIRVFCESTKMWLIYAILAAILWGFNYALAEKILHSISTVTLLALEMLVGAILFIVIAYFTTMKKDLNVLMTEPSVLWLTILEIAVVIFASFFIVSSIRFKNATVAGIIELIYPLFTILFTWYLFHESHVNLPVIVGGGLIFIGVIVISLS